MSERWEGLDEAALAARCGIGRVVLCGEVASTMDVAHALAADGADGGTLVLTDRQVAGRGRSGRHWHSDPGASITLSLLERPTDRAAIGVLSLRLGLAAAAVLDGWAREPVLLKWPNDLMLPAGKLGGILVEARWRQDALDWVVLGIGINVRAPELPATSGLAAGASRLEILPALVPALHAASSGTGGLDHVELGAWARRDWARGRLVEAPARGTAEGVAADGALLVRTPHGVVSCTSGSLVLSEA